MSKEFTPSIKFDPLIRTKKQNIVKIIWNRLLLSKLSKNGILVSSTSVEDVVTKKVIIKNCIIILKFGELMNSISDKTPKININNNDTKRNRSREITL